LMYRYRPLDIAFALLGSWNSKRFAQELEELSILFSGISNSVMTRSFRNLFQILQKVRCIEESLLLTAMYLEDGTSPWSFS
jgi:hypothetical protein